MAASARAIGKSDCRPFQAIKTARDVPLSCCTRLTTRPGRLRWARAASRRATPAALLITAVIPSRRRPSGPTRSGPGTGAAPATSPRKKPVDFLARAYGRDSLSLAGRALGAYLRVTASTCAGPPRPVLRATAIWRMQGPCICPWAGAHGRRGWSDWTPITDSAPRNAVDARSPGGLVHETHRNRDQSSRRAPAARRPQRSRRGGAPRRRGGSQPAGCGRVRTLRQGQELPLARVRAPLPRLPPPARQAGRAGHEHDGRAGGALTQARPGDDPLRR